MDRKSYFYRLISCIKFSRDTGTKRCCLELIDFLIKRARDTEQSYYFEELYQNISHDYIDRNEFIYAVFKLVEINILEQKFQALDLTGTYQTVNKKEILHILNSQKYINPITGDELTKQQFEEQVITFFTVTEYFLNPHFCLLHN